MRTYARAGAVCAIGLATLFGSAVPARAQNTSLFLDSQPGDPLGGGIVQTFSPPALTFEAWRESDNSITAVVHNADYSTYWFILVGAPDGAVLTPGMYAPAGAPTWRYLSLMVIGSQTGCIYATGRFQVLEVVYGAGDSIERLAVDVEQHCEDAGPALVAALRFNSTVASNLPFGGSYFQYGLTLDPPAHGTITAEAIACGGGESACAASFASPTMLEMTATPEAGYIFMGWTGECHGGATTTVHVNGLKHCGASFAPEPPVAPRHLLALYSAQGDYVGEGRTELYSAANSYWEPYVAFDRNAIFLHVYGLGPRGEGYWRVMLRAPVGQVLTTGSYPYAVEWATDFLPGLSLMTEGRWCDSVGRFEVTELEFDADGSLAKLAADIEHHCGTATPALFAAVRYNSTRAGVLPFGSITPRYELSIGAHPHGTVTGGGINCGAGEVSCSVTYPEATTVALMALPAPGYLFTGWTGACAGGASTTILVNTVRTCAATFEEIGPTTPRTLLLLDSQSGDPVGGGQKLVFTPANASFALTRVTNNTVTLRVSPLGGSWFLELAAPQGEALTVGTYAPATRYPFTPFAGLDISGNGSGCNQLTGRFVVLDIAYASDGSVLRLAADVEQHCNDLDPGLFAAIRYNSPLPAAPFGGAYPRYEISITPPVGGKVTGQGIACGGGETSCGATFGAATSVTLTATPDANSIFTGWGGACSGARTTTVHVNSVKTCAATFDSIVATAPRTLLYLDSAPGDSVGQGKHQAYSTANSLWTVTSSVDGHGIDVRLYANGPLSAVDWTLLFRAPAGRTLQPGTYSPVSRASFPTTAAGLEVFGNAGICESVVGSFTIHELIRDAQSGHVTALALDFEQRCQTESAPALAGTLRYNSTIGVPLRGVWLSPEAMAPVRYNTSVTWTATAFPDVGVEYAFWRFDASNGWHNVQPYGPSADYTWVPGFADVGSHSLQVWARRVGSAPPYEVWRGTTFAVEAASPPVISGLTVTPSPPFLIGTQIVWTTTASGGYPPLQYQFWRLDGTAWKMVRDYSLSPTYAWTPGPGDVGPHALQVWVRNADSLAPYDAYYGMSFEIRTPAPVAITALTPHPGATIAAGQTITWTASAIGGTPPLQYQFFRLDGNSWKLIQPYGGAPTNSWTPGAADVGPHSVQVWVRSSGSTAAYEAWSGADFVVTGAAPVRITALTSSPATPPAAGMPTTWTVTASGGLEPLQYQFWRLDGGTWKMVRDYAPLPAYTWTPGSADVGEHSLQVWVRSSGSTAAYEAWSGTAFSVTGPAPVTVTGLTIVPGVPGSVGVPMSWLASATGGIAPLQYQFWRLDSDGWKIVQDYSPSSSYLWTPTAADVGAHAVQVWVRSAGSTGGYEAWLGSGMFYVLAPIVPPPGASPTLSAMIQGLSAHISAALANEQALLPRNPSIAPFIEAKIALLSSPTLASEIVTGQRWFESGVPSMTGSTIPVVTIFSQEAMRADATQAVSDIVAGLPLLEGFMDRGFPTAAIRIWYGFGTGSSGGGGTLLVEDKATYLARTGPTRLPHEAIVYHEVAHSYIAHESLTQFLELYLYNRRTAPADVNSWTFTRNYTPWLPTNAGIAALLDVYQLIGEEAMARAFRAAYLLQPAYGQPLSAQCQQVFVDEAPAAVSAQVAALMARVTY